MKNEILLAEIEKYHPNTLVEKQNAMREVLQKLILIGLSKNGFFKRVAFYGGTSLRVLYNLTRFSEDLDFFLLNPNQPFELLMYLEKTVEYLKSFGLVCTINNKEKITKTSVDTAYISFNLKALFEQTYPEDANHIQKEQTLPIKIETEKNTFDGYILETKLITTPSFAQVITFSLDTLFASKLIAVLNRKWKTRIKGRDFYDYLFYITNVKKVNIHFLENGLKQYGYLEKNDSYSIQHLKEDLKKRFNELDYTLALKDLLPFIKKNDALMAGFNKEVFLLSVDELTT